MSFSLKGTKDIFVSASKSGNGVLRFLLETALFILIAGVTGLIISLPIYYFGTEFTDLYKQTVSLGLVFFILSFFVYRFYKVSQEEWQILSNISVISPWKKKQLAFIYSAPNFLPRWFGPVTTFCFWFFLALIGLILIIVLVYLLLYLLIDSFNIENAHLSYLQGLIEKIAAVAYNFMIGKAANKEELEILLIHSRSNVLYFSTGFLWTIFIFIELVILMTIYEVKSILAKSSKLRFLSTLSPSNEKGLGEKISSLNHPFIWYFTITGLHLVLLYIYLYFLVFYKAITLLVV